MLQTRLQGATLDGLMISGTNHMSGQHAQKTPMIEELWEIQDPIKMCRYLEKTLLIVYPGQISSPGLLSTALHHVTEYKGVPKQSM